MSTIRSRFHCLHFLIIWSFSAIDRWQGNQPSHNRRLFVTTCRHGPSSLHPRAPCINGLPSQVGRWAGGLGDPPASACVLVMLRLPRRSINPHGCTARRLKSPTILVAYHTYHTYQPKRSLCAQADLSVCFVLGKGHHCVRSAPTAAYSAPSITPPQRFRA